jgi:uncharacterized protein YkwD
MNVKSLAEQFYLNDLTIKLPSILFTKAKRKYVFRIFYLSLLFTVITSAVHAESTSNSPLAKYSASWNNQDYIQCNTAKEASYLSESEKEVIYILNLVRKNPALFAETVLKNYPDEINKPQLKKSNYFKSLMATLQQLSELKMLEPDLIAYGSAHCHATSSGKTGYVGHERQTKECEKVKNFMGECCSYGAQSPLNTVINLLIDEGVSSLGHRKILLGNYSAIGVSIKPHKEYKVNTVIDLR